MINRYPLWKNLLVLLIVSLGVVYALPNIYPPDFAIQISNEDPDGTVTEQALDKAVSSLADAEIDYFGAKITGSNAEIRFQNEDMRLRAVDVIELALHDETGAERFIVSLNAAPTTPEWLVGIGGEPMKYGLDLRGGVHFLMEVDTEAAIAERIEGLEQDIKRLFRERDDRIRYRGFNSPETGVMEITFADEDLRDRARSKLNTRYPQYNVTASPQDRKSVV